MKKASGSRNHSELALCPRRFKTLIKAVEVSRIKHFQEYDVVVIDKILYPKTRSFGAKLLPSVGDEGTIVDIIDHKGKRIYTVERIDDDGCILWLSDFIEEELSLKWRANTE